MITREDVNAAVVFYISLLGPYNELSSHDKMVARLVIENLQEFGSIQPTERIVAQEKKIIQEPMPTLPKQEETKTFVHEPPSADHPWRKHYHNHIVNADKKVCIDCKNPERKVAAKGRCINCYARFHRNKDAPKVKSWLDSENITEEGAVNTEERIYPQEPIEYKSHECPNLDNEPTHPCDRINCYNNETEIPMSQLIKFEGLNFCSKQCRDWYRN